MPRFMHRSIARLPDDSIMPSLLQMNFSLSAYAWCKGHWMATFTNVFWNKWWIDRNSRSLKASFFIRLCLGAVHSLAGIFYDYCLSSSRHLIWQSTSQKRTQCSARCSSPCGLPLPCLMSQLPLRPKVNRDLPWVMETVHDLPTVCFETYKR